MKNVFRHMINARVLATLYILIEHPRYPVTDVPPQPNAQSTPVFHLQQDLSAYVEVGR